VAAPLRKLCLLALALAFGATVIDGYTGVAGLPDATAPTAASTVSAVRYGLSADLQSVRRVSFQLSGASSGVSAALVARPAAADWAPCRRADRRVVCTFARAVPAAVAQRLSVTAA
jgi:hypothetical protein